MTALATKEGAHRRYANFFRGNSRERDTTIAYDALEAQALNVVRESIVAHALSMHRELSSADLSRMLAAAQSQLRGLPPEDLRGISPSSAILKMITDYSFAAAPVNADGTQAALTAAATLDQGVGRDFGTMLAARMLRLDRERASSSRYEDLGGERLSQSDLQNMAAARATAQDLGMAWALNNPELLKLGPSAIKTLHEAGVQRERFERMTGDKVGFRAATAVDIATFAKRHNLTPEQTNRLYDKISDGVEIISGGNKAIQRELDVATDRYVTEPDTPEARRTLEDAYRKHADTPEKREAADRTARALEEAAQQAHAKVIKADIAEAKNDDTLAGLNSPQSSNSPPVPDTKSTPVKAPVPQALKSQAPK